MAFDHKFEPAFDIIPALSKEAHLERFFLRDGAGESPAKHGDVMPGGKNTVDFPSPARPAATAPGIVWVIINKMEYPQFPVQVSNISMAFETTLSTVISAKHGEGVLWHPSLGLVS